MRAVLTVYFANPPASREISADERWDQFLRHQDARTTAFPDVSHTFEEQIAEGDLVATRMTQHGTHSGEYMGIPSTGRRTSMTGIAIHRIVGGKVAAVWPSPDLLGLLQQLGDVPRSGR